MKRYVELIYRIIFIIISGICIGIHFSIYDGDYNAHEFSFFTVQSNIFCFVIMCVLLIKYFMGRDLCSKCLIYFKGMALSAILCTFLVYHFAECRIKYPLSIIGIFGLPVKTLFSHYITPFMFILDWIIFQPKGYFKWWHIVGWLAFPLTYFLSFITRCNCNSAAAFVNVEKYPYFFLDYETLGVGRFCSYILVLLMIIVAENILIVMLDKYMFRVSKGQTFLSRKFLNKKKAD
ncbi:MAG: Pr6Pr family membrane protein [Eubacterium sp.]